MKIHSKILSLLFVPVLGSFFGCGEKPGKDGGEAEADASFAYVTNGVDPFWD